MKLSDKLKQFVGKKGHLTWGADNHAYVQFSVSEMDNPKVKIEEVGDDYVVLNQGMYGSFIIPLNLIVVIFH